VVALFGVVAAVVELLAVFVGLYTALDALAVLADFVRSAFGDRRPLLAGVVIVVAAGAESILPYRRNPRLQGSRPL